ncbi:MAG TPA: Asp/Glu racemase, partial [Paraburkholderia sp.]|nr:Asp/Glu racemase [Paraburkholderia sp.]
TVAPTTRLFLDAARDTGAEIEVRLVVHAWERFKAGDLPGYLGRIAQAADAAYDDGASVVALAQASMAAAAGLVKPSYKRPPGSPDTGLSAAVRSVRGALRHAT